MGYCNISFLTCCHDYKHCTNCEGLWSPEPLGKWGPDTGPGIGISMCEFSLQLCLRKAGLMC